MGHVGAVSGYVLSGYRPCIGAVMQHDNIAVRALGPRPDRGREGADCGEEQQANEEQVRESGCFHGSSPMWGSPARG